MSSASIFPVIIAGGVGSRLWPVSRKSWPKQFCRLIDELSLFQSTIIRVSDAVFQKPIIVTSSEYRFIVSDQLAQINVSGEVYLEPEGKNTAPAVFASAIIAKEKCKDAIIAVLPSDHAIEESRMEA